jgi:hypothetical protein
LASAATASGNISIQTSPAYVVSPSLLYGANAVCSTSSATFADGRFVIVYIDASTVAVYASIFSITGVLQTTISVGTAYSTPQQGQVSVATLPSGKFVVSYMSTSSVITNAMYSSAYAFISNSTISSVSFSSSYGIGSAGLSNERFVVVFSGSQPKYQVFDATNTSITSATSVLGATAYNVCVAANQWGGFTICYYYSSTQYMFGVYNSSGNTYTATNTITFSSSNGILNQKAAFANGYSYSLYTNSSSSYSYIGYADEGGLSYNSSGTINSLDTVSYGNIAIGTTALGNPVLFYPITGQTPSTPIYSWSNRIPALSNAVTFPNSSGFALTGATFRGATSYGACPTVTPNIANNVAVAWCNSSGYLYYAIVNAMPVCANLPATAGVTSSNTTSVVPTATTVNSTAISGTFVGVAASTAPSGGSGQVVVNGVAKLNANYTGTASGAFDHTGTAVPGAKGTYKGNIVNLQGNT